MEPNLVGARACWTQSLVDRGAVEPKPVRSKACWIDNQLHRENVRCIDNKKGDPVGSPFNSGTDQKNQLKVIVDDPYLYRSSFSFAAS